MEMTKPRSKTTPIKEMRRLKKDSVPSKQLILSAKEEQHLLHEDTIQHMEAEAIHSIEKNNEERENNDMTQNTASINNTEMDRVLQQLRDLEEKQQQLLQVNEKLENKNVKLNMEPMQLREEVTQIKKNNQKEVEETVINTLRKVFTAGQIKILMSSTRRRVRWSVEDIMSAISLRSLSPKAYKYLKNVKKFPLPSLTTLHYWITNFNVSPGILKDAMNIMASKGHEWSTIEKLTVLSFDDVYVSNKLDIDRKAQKIYGLHKTCLFIMA